MKAKFIGDPRSPKEPLPDTFSAYGVEFEKDKFSDVPDSVAWKFAGNDHYQIEGAIPDVVEADVPEKPERIKRPRIKRPDEPEETVVE